MDSILDHYPLLPDARPRSPGRFRTSDLSGHYAERSTPELPVNGWLVGPTGFEPAPAGPQPAVQPSHSGPHDVTTPGARGGYCARRWGSPHGTDCQWNQVFTQSKVTRRRGLSSRFLRFARTSAFRALETWTHAPPTAPARLALLPFSTLALLAVVLLAHQFFLPGSK